MPSSPISSARWAAIRLFAMDVDGILTDGTVLVGPGGFEAKRFSVRDGLGFKMLRELGLPVAWISGRLSPATTVRAAELKVLHLKQDRPDKLEALSEIVLDLGLGLADCIYMGDDVIDAPALSAAGIGVSVPGAAPEALRAADYVTSHRGGKGAVREVCDLILAARKKPSKAAR